MSTIQNIEKKTVRASTLNWYGFTAGGGLADILLAGNPLTRAKELRGHLNTLIKALESERCQASVRAEADQRWREGGTTDEA